jgi:hypothetical protein
MGFTTFLLRLVGRDPEQLREQEKFKENLGKLDETDQELDALMVEIRQIDKVWEEKKATMEAASSERPPPISMEMVLDNGQRVEPFGSDPEV